jgi:hypothetical protein
VPFGPVVLILTPAATAEIVRAASRRSGSHNARRRVVEQLLWRHLYSRLLEARARPAREAASADDPASEDWSSLSGADDELADIEQRSADSDVTAAELGNQLRRLPVVVEALDRMWPVMTPQEVLHDLFGAPPLVELAGRGLLSDAEQTLLVRARSESADVVAWTDADLALLDEARALLGTHRRRPNGERTAISSSTRPRICRPCNGGCSVVAACHRR